MSFQLTILGSSGAIPVYGRFTSAQHLVVQNRQFLIDCGEGTQMQLIKANLSAHKIDHIFISHLHGDHYLGLMGLLFSMHLNHREAELHLYSFRGLDEIILAQLRHSQSSLNFKLNFHELEPDVRETVFEDKIVTVETIPLLHKIKCSGFLFREKPRLRKIAKEKLANGMLLQHIVQLKMGQDVLDDRGQLLYRNQDFTLDPKAPRAYAYCSDTAFYPDLAAQLKDIDLLYHEATFMDEEKNKALETKHSTASEAAHIARLVQPKKLIIGHFSARYKELDGLLSEARSIFPNTELAIECHTFDLNA